MTVVIRALLSLTRTRSKTKNGTLFATWNHRNELTGTSGHEHKHTNTLSRAWSTDKELNWAQNTTTALNSNCRKVPAPEISGLGQKFLSPDFCPHLPETLSWHMSEFLLVDNHHKNKNIFLLEVKHEMQLSRRTMVSLKADNLMKFTKQIFVQIAILQSAQY